MKPILIDTGVIVSLFDKSQIYHQECANTVDSCSGPLITCEAVISESCFLLKKIPKAIEALMINIKKREIQVPFRFDQSVLRIEKLLRQYRNIPMSFADASLVALAEQFETPFILTTDSDFKTYRWKKNTPFKLLVELG